MITVNVENVFIIYVYENKIIYILLISPVTLIFYVHGCILLECTPIRCVGIDLMGYILEGKEKEDFTFALI